MPPATYEDASSSSETRFEERCVATVLIVAGAVGLMIGVDAPRTHGTELVLGALLVALGLWTLAPWPWHEKHSSRAPSA